jgi:hypothetical protein
MMMNISISRTLISVLRTATSRKEKRIAFSKGLGTLNAKKCPTSHEVRAFPEKLRKRQVDDGTPCWRSWGGASKPDINLRAITAGDVEHATPEIARRDILAYFGELIKALAQIQNPAQLLNMDETGFCSSPKKARKKKVIYKMIVRRNRPLGN